MIKIRSIKIRKFEKLNAEFGISKSRRCAGSRRLSEISEISQPISRSISCPISR